MNLKDNLIAEYKNHYIFNDLEDYISFYAYLETSTYPWVTQGVDLFNFDTYVYTSIKETLNSIKLILENGRLNDGYSLVRKYYDSIVINSYIHLYLEENVNIKNLKVDKINNWLLNKEKIPEYKIMNSFLRNSIKLKPFNKLIFKDKLYRDMRQRLNDHLHYNYFKHMLDNNNEIYNKELKKLQLLEELAKDIRNIFILHFIWIFSIKNNYMMSSDFADYMDVGDTPPEGSQYWVAPYVQEIFDKIIKKYSPDLAVLFKKMTPMKLD